MKEEREKYWSAQWYWNSVANSFLTSPSYFCVRNFFFGVLLAVIPSTEKQMSRNVSGVFCLRAFYQIINSVWRLTLRRSQPIWEAHTTLHLVPCHPYSVLNPHISSSFLTHSALSNPILSCIPTINSSSYGTCDLRISMWPNSSHFWRCVFYMFVLCIRLK